MACIVCYRVEFGVTAVPKVIEVDKQRCAFGIVFATLLLNSRIDFADFILDIAIGRFVRDANWSTMFVMKNISCGTPASGADRMLHSKILIVVKCRASDLQPFEWKRCRFNFDIGTLEFRVRNLDEIPKSTIPPLCVFAL